MEPVDFTKETLIGPRFCWRGTPQLQETVQILEEVPKTSVGSMLCSRAISTLKTTAPISGSFRSVPLWVGSPARDVDRVVAIVEPSSERIFGR